MFRRGCHASRRRREDYFPPPRFCMCSRFPSLLYKRIARTTEEYLVRFDCPCRKAESHMPLRVLFPGHSSPSFACRMHPSPGMTNSRRWPACMGDVGMAPAPRQMGRLLGPPGGAVRQHVPAATEVDAYSSGDDFAAWMAYRKAKKSLARKEEAGDEYQFQNRQAEPALFA